MKPHTLFIGFLSLLLAGTFLISCSEEGSAPETSEPASASESLVRFKTLSGSLRIAGGTAHLGVMEEAKKRIMTVNPDISITVEGGGSGVGVKKAGEGLVDIGNTGRSLSEEEIKKYGLISFAFAVDGVAVAVHPDNRVKALTSQQAKDIFSGKITNWKEVGGDDQRINLYSRDKESGTRNVFWKKLLEQGEVSEQSNFVASNGAMKTAVSKDKGGIGYISIGYIDSTVSPVMIDGIAPTQEHAKNGTYKVTRKLYMNTKGKPSGLAKAFVDYLMSAEAAEIIKAKGYIPVLK